MLVFLVVFFLAGVKAPANFTAYYHEEKHQIYAEKAFGKSKNNSNYTLMGFVSFVLENEISIQNKKP